VSVLTLLDDELLGFFIEEFIFVFMLPDGMVGLIPGSWNFLLMN
jgi:hypothetical protein